MIQICFLHIIFVGGSSFGLNEEILIEMQIPWPHNRLVASAGLEWGLKSGFLRILPSESCSHAAVGTCALCRPLLIVTEL